jgi:starch phosphorylase
LAHWLIIRWVLQCNPQLAALITHTLGSDQWLLNSKLLANLLPMADNAEFRKAFRAIKQDNKRRLAEVLESELGISINLNSIFACQIKRLHEYKRQTLNIFAIIYRYLRIKQASPEERKKMQPWTFIFAGKAAPGYYIAKLVIRLIVNVGKVVNNDPDVGDLLRVAFIPDYSVSIAEVLIPAADLSVQISTAGTEASGTVCHLEVIGRYAQLSLTNIE